MLLGGHAVDDGRIVPQSVLNGRDGRAPARATIIRARIPPRCTWPGRTAGRGAGRAIRPASPRRPRPGRTAGRSMTTSGPSHPHRARGMSATDQERPPPFLPDRVRESAGEILIADPPSEESALIIRRLHLRVTTRARTLRLITRRRNQIGPMISIPAALKVITECGVSGPARKRRRRKIRTLPETTPIAQTQSPRTTDVDELDILRRIPCGDESLMAIDQGHPRNILPQSNHIHDDIDARERRNHAGVVVHIDDSNAIGPLRRRPTAFFIRRPAHAGIHHGRFGRFLMTAIPVRPVAPRTSTDLIGRPPCERRRRG